MLLAISSVCGCSDATRPHREKLALCFIQELAPLELDFDAIPAEMHRMHMGAESGKRSAAIFDAFLAESHPLDPDTIQLVERYRDLQLKYSEQFATAVAENRSELNEMELKITTDCSRQILPLGTEICQRIDYDSLVDIHP